MQPNGEYEWNCLNYFREDNSGSHLSKDDRDHYFYGKPEAPREVARPINKLEDTPFLFKFRLSNNLLNNNSPDIRNCMTNLFLLDVFRFAAVYL